jgi:hypothetical protein
LAATASTSARRSASRFPPTTAQRRDADARRRHRHVPRQGAAAGTSIACSRRAGAEHQRKVETEKALTEAVQRGEFLLAFQPQLSLVTGE